MRSALPRLAAAVSVAVVLAPRPAAAIEVPDVGGKPLLIDVTNTAVVDYHFNNRNDQNLNIYNQLDDNYGEFLDRLNIQASYWRFRLGVRLDSSVYFHQFDRGDVAALVADQKPIIDAYALSHGLNAQKYANDTYATGFLQDLHTRYLRSFYPTKLFIGYAQPGVDVTVGDFYAQLGRGLVFSVRKIDELAVDTTVRGIKVVADREVGPVQLGLTLFGGQMNPLRVEEVSGRRLHGDGSPLFFGFPNAGALETYNVGDQPGRVRTYLQPATPNYLEDTALGGSLSGATKWFTLAGQAAAVLRKSHTRDWLACRRAQGDATTMGDTQVQQICASRFPEFSSSDPSKEHDRIVNWSGSINVPSILKHGDLYVEVAGQSMQNGHLTYDAQTSDVTGAKPSLSGYAVYAAASVTAGGLAVSLEGKHYRNFFPLSANIDTQRPGFGAPEYALVTYSQAPTAEPIYTEIVGGGSPSVCVTGGRARVDYRFKREASVYAWLGRYSSWSEIPNTLDNGCSVDAKSRTDTWDTAIGVDLGFESRKTHLKAWVGARTTDYADVSASTVPGSTVFYREGYVRYDIVKHLAGPFSLQLQGFHRHRHEPLLDANPWTEGENYTALQWSPHLSAIFGYEYLAKDKCQPARDATLSQPARADKSLCHYVNGGLQWRAAGAGEGKPATKYVAQLFDAVSLFVGQRRAALRCVSGVCRQFPPFEGARLEITSRF